MDFFTRGSAAILVWVGSWGAVLDPRGQGFGQCGGATWHWRARAVSESACSIRPLRSHFAQTLTPSPAQARRGEPPCRPAWEEQQDSCGKASPRTGPDWFRAAAAYYPMTSGKGPIDAKGVYPRQVGVRFVGASLQPCPEGRLLRSPRGRSLWRGSLSRHPLGMEAGGGGDT